MSGLFHELVQTRVYKKAQGRITRQVTFAAMAVLIALGVYRLTQTLEGAGAHVQWGVPGALLILGLWFSFRIVNMPNFADFLIAVEAEMNKVSWPTRSELFRGSLVVLITIFVLAAVLYVFDLVWNYIFNAIGIFA